MNLSEKDKRYTWHPFTQHQTEPDMPVIVSAKGASLFDENGNEILDMISSWWTCVHGHSNSELNQALSDQAEQLEHVMFAGFSHPSAINLAEELAIRLPEDLNRTFFSDNGSTAIEIALKIAYQYWKNKGQDKRTKFLAFDGAYHGETVGAMSLGKGCGFFDLFDDLMFEVEALPYVETWNGDKDVKANELIALHQIKQMIESEKHKIAAVIVEPLMQGAGGIRLCRPEFIKRVVEIVQANDVLVIFDEVAVGFGRLGSLFACEKIGVTPDLICLSKGLTAGYLPMSVTVATDRVFNVFLSDDIERGFLHSHSFSGNPLACAVALKSLQMFEENKLLDKITYIENRHKDFLYELQKHHKIYKPRAMGSIVAFNISVDNLGYKNKKSEALRNYFLRNGLNIRPIGDVVYLMPPYCITDEQLDCAYNGIIKGLEFISEIPLSQVA